MSLLILNRRGLFNFKALFFVIALLISVGTEVSYAQGPTTIERTINVHISLTLQKDSGDNQYCCVNSSPTDVLKVKVVNKNGNGVPGATINFAVATYPTGATGQSVSPGSDVTDANGEASTQFTAGDKPGTYTITATATNTEVESGSPQTFTATAVKIEQDYNLWWFNGENAANYHEEVTLTANGTTTGSFHWTVTAGTDKVNFENDTDDITLNNDNDVGVKSTAASATNNDVSIQLAINGQNVCTHQITVYAPTSSPVIAGPTDSSWGPGFQTLYTMEVRDQFGTQLPNDIEVNEDFGTWVSDFAGENWPEPSPNGVMAAGAQFTDTYAYQWQGATPQPVNPIDPNANVTVQHAPQYYRAGNTTIGDGIQVKTHTLQFYRGKGRQE